MKKLLLFVIAVLLTFGGFSQLTPTYDGKVLLATIQFGKTIPVGNKILDVSTGKLYLCLTATASTASLSSVPANFRDLGDYNSLSNLPTITSGTVTSISQGTWMLNSVNPLVSSGTIGVDTSKVMGFNDTLLLGKIATKKNLIDGLSLKANISDSLKRVYDSLTNIYTQGQVDGLLGAKQNVSDTSVKDATRYWVGLQGFLTAFSETDPIWLSDSSDYYKKTTADNRFAPISHTQAISTVTGLQDSITNHYTKSQIDNFFSGVVAESGYNKSTWDALVTMTYPGTGIALSSGSAWSGSITNNSVAWNNARAISNHDSLSALDEKSYNSLTDKPNLSVYRTHADHDSLTNLDERSYNSLTDKPAINDTLLTRVYQGTGTLVTGSAPSYTIKADTGLVETKVLATSQLALKVPKTTTISTTSPLMGGGDLSTNRTFYLNTDSLAALARRHDTINLLLSRVRAGHDFEPKITAGTTSQYWRGDKTWQTTPLGTVTGTGTLSYIPKWLTGGASLGDSPINVVTGYVGINKATPLMSFHVKAIDADATARFEYYNNDSYIQIGNSATYHSLSTSYYSTGSYLPIYITPGGNQNLILQSAGTGNVGIGTVAPYYGLDVNNNVRVQGTYSYGFGGTTGAYTDRFYSPSSGIISTGSQLQSTLATGTSPLAVTSTTVNANLNADLLDGHHWADVPAAVDTTTAGTGLVNKTRMSHITSYPTLNQNTTGTAAGLAAAYIDWTSGSGGTSIKNKPTILTIGGSNTRIQYNNSGVLAGSSDFTWNNSSKLLNVGGSIRVAMFDSLYALGVNGITGITLSSSEGEESVNLVVANDTILNVNPAGINVNGTITSAPTYTTTVGSTNKPLFVDNTGLIGVGGSSYPHIAGCFSGSTNKTFAASNHWYSLDTLFTGATKFLTISDSYLFTASHDTITYTGASGHVKFEIHLSVSSESWAPLAIGLFNITDNAGVPVCASDYVSVSYSQTAKASLVIVDVNASTNDKYIIKYKNLDNTGYLSIFNIFFYAELIH